jgi:hypothetical protein
MNRLFFITCLASLSGSALAQGIGPTPYLQVSDSPWAAYVGTSNFYLENFEDGLLNTPGVKSSPGAGIIKPGLLTDSVDEDDGVIDGKGYYGHAWYFSKGTQGITFTFDSAVLGGLPTMAGLVWTDGAGTIEFEAFDKNGISLGKIFGDHANAEYSGLTEDDRFYGWEHAEGIGSIFIRNTKGGIEVDHLQYGTVPEPATFAVLTLGALGVLRRKKSK